MCLQNDSEQSKQIEVIVIKQESQNSKVLKYWKADMGRSVFQKESENTDDLLVWNVSNNQNVDKGKKKKRILGLDQATGAFRIISILVNEFWKSADCYPANRRDKVDWPRWPWFQFTL